MFLYELALELEEKSVDLAARAQQMGIPGALPNTELTKAQVTALRGEGPMPGGSESPMGGPAPLAWGVSPPGAPPVPQPLAPQDPASKRRLGRAVTNQIAADVESLRPKRRMTVRIGPSLVILVMAVGVVALVAYMAVNMGSLEDKKAELAASTARAEAETKADAARSAADLLTPTSAASGASPSGTPGSTPAATPTTTEAPTSGGASPALKERGITDEATFCSAAEVAAPWMADVVSKTVADRAGPGGSTLAQWLRDRPLPLDGAFADLDGATSGPLHEDVVALAGAFVFMRDGIVGPNADDVTTAALDSMQRLRAPGVSAAAERLSAATAISCG